MNYRIKKFIKDHLVLIDSNKWEEFYIEVGSESDVGGIFQLDTDVGRVTEFLLSCGCEPLKYTQAVPACYLCGIQTPIVTIPTTIWSIGCSAFAENNELRRVQIPANVEVINVNAFECCKNLTYVQIDNPDVTIHDWAFYGCHNIKQIDFAGTVLQWREKELTFLECTVVCSDGKVIYNHVGEFV